MIKLRGNPLCVPSYDNRFNIGIPMQVFAFNDFVYVVFEVKGIVSDNARLTVDSRHSFETLLAHAVHKLAFNFGMEDAHSDMEQGSVPRFWYYLKFASLSRPDIEHLLGVVPIHISDLFSAIGFSNLEITRFKVERSKVSQNVDANRFMGMADENFDVMSEEQFKGFMDSVGGLLNSEIYKVKVEAKIPRGEEADKILFCAGATQKKLICKDG
jgi:hypothetical protein